MKRKTMARANALLRPTQRFRKPYFDPRGNEKYIVSRRLVIHAVRTTLFQITIPPPVVQSPDQESSPQNVSEAYGIR